MSVDNLGETVRYYCAQWNDTRAGWIDLPENASMKKIEVVRFAESFAFEYRVQMRVIRKPKGWNPAGKFNTLPRRYW